MAGLPGSGKSALARVIARRTGAVQIDKDVLKTAILEGGVSDDQHAGGIAYETMFALAEHLLGQDLAVVLDSPSFYESIPAKGAAIAAARHVPYYFIECLCADQGELRRRLQQRPRMRSQPLVFEWRDATTHAPGGPYLRVDTTQPLERCLELALEYLGVDSAGR
jgi:predicted kinase